MDLGRLTLLFIVTTVPGKIRILRCVGGVLYSNIKILIGLFVLCCKGTTGHVIDLIDEAHKISKGSNAAVSYLHHFSIFMDLGED